MNRRVAVLASALPLLCLSTLVGCALVAGTNAQSLAEERMRQCDRFASVQLSRIDADGGVWATYRVSAEDASWRECMNRAADAQAARGVELKSRALYSERVGR